MNWEVVTYLINAEVDVSLVFEDGTTVLEYAVCAYNWDLARSLIAVANADVNTIFKRREGHFNTVLHAACVTCPDIGFVAFLLEAGANPNIPGVQRGYEFELPLQTACSLPLVSARIKDRVDLLLEYGADPNALGLTYGGGLDGNALQRAASNGLKDIVDQLLRNGADPNLSSGSGFSALQSACHRNFIDIVRILLEAGADPNINNDESYQPAIYSACMHQNLGMLILVLEKGADPNQSVRNSEDNDGIPVLYSWCSMPDPGFDDVVRILLEYGANPNILCQPKGETARRTPLFIAVTQGHVKRAQLLLENGADPLDVGGGYILSSQSSLLTAILRIYLDNETALHWARQKNSEESDMVQLLLRYGPATEL
ncbi:hypothetical protein NMY22_g4789 [Coprinellus aureogranulatus]|nr:hypothetical protein NMY22_g4789 [Coprinellus aureogranulatus]